MDIEKSALTLIERAYDAAMAPDKWMQMLATFFAMIDSNSAVLREVNYNSGTVGLFSTVGYDPVYSDHFVHLDVCAQAQTKFCWRDNPRRHCRTLETATPY